MRAGDREEDASPPSKADPTTDPPRPDEHNASGANASTTTATTTTGVAGGGDKRTAPGPSIMGATARTAPRYLLRIQYDGTNFHGFQRQANARTVQGVVEDALGAFAGGGGKGKGAHEPIRTCGSSRTDAGVHALDNTVHVDLSRVSNRKPSVDAALPPHKPHTIVAAVNHFLKKTAPDARLTGCVRVDPQKFHARFSATGRTYHYRMHVSPEPPNLFERGRVWHVSSGNGTRVMVGGGGGERGSGVKGDGDWGLDLEAMRAAAAHLVGERDFSTFRASGCQASSPVRTLWDIRVDASASWPPFPAAAIESARPDDFSKTQVIDEDEDEDGIGQERRKKRTKTGGVDGGTQARRRGPLTLGGVVITVSGPSFLYHQVRLMVSTLRAVGAGAIDPDDVPALLARKTPAAVPAMAPAHGLYLGRVHYDGTREWSPRTEVGTPAEGGDE